MIKQIKLRNIATFVNEEKVDLKKINYFFGGNGSGKTTISKMLNSVDTPSQKFSVEWENTDHEKVLVFNRYFIKDNMEEVSELGGVYTIGHDAIKQQHEIDKLNEEIDRADKKLRELNSSKIKLEEERNNLNAQLENKCWELKATPHISKEKTTALSLDKEKCGLVVFYWQGKLN